MSGVSLTEKQMTMCALVLLSSDDESDKETGREMLDLMHGATPVEFVAARQPEQVIVRLKTGVFRMAL